MALTPDQIAQNILAKLSVTDPALSLEIGTPERKIVDACAEAISESTIDNYLLGYNLDIDTKSGADLEAFVGLFGFARQAGRYATGTVQFSLAYPATSDVLVTKGSQVFAPASVTGTTDLYFNTTAQAVISQGTQTTSVSVACVAVGAIGNVASTSIIGFGGGYGIALVSNSSPLSGGIDPETDNGLRERFKKTFLRNITGTQGFYAALMLQNQYTSQVNVVGPYTYYLEEIQFNGYNKVYSTNTNAKYTWPDGWWLYINQGLPEEVFYVSGVDYIVDQTVSPPGITPLHPDLVATGATANFEYQYTPNSSRNDPENNISNKVDLFVNGNQTTDVSEVIVCSAGTFSATTTAVNYTGNFKRADQTPVVAGHRFQPLGSAPIIAFPNVIYSTTNTYILGADYVGVQSNTKNRGSVRELAGVEWLTTAPTAGIPLTLSYTYNRVPELMQSIMTAQRQLTTDVLVHQADYRALFFSVVVSYNYSVSVTAVNNLIISALQKLVGNYFFGNYIQMSDIIQTVHNVAGVDNCRMAKQTDVPVSAAYGVAYRLNTVVQTIYSQDFKLNDNELPLYDGVQIIRRSQNTFNN